MLTDVNIPLAQRELVLDDIARYRAFESIKFEEGMVAPMQSGCTTSRWAVV